MFVIITARGNVFKVSELTLDDFIGADTGCHTLIDASVADKPLCYRLGVWMEIDFI